MRCEDFSEPVALTRQSPIYDNKFEFMALLALIIMNPVINKSKNKNEKKLRSEAETSNAWAEMKVN